MTQNASGRVPGERRGTKNSLDARRVKRPRCVHVRSVKSETRYDTRDMCGNEVIKEKSGGGGETNALRGDSKMALRRRIYFWCIPVKPTERSTRLTRRRCSARKIRASSC